jgi:WD40 repeat protein
MLNHAGGCELWEVMEGRRVGTVQGFLQGLHSVCFSPDGERLAIGSNGNEAIKLWDVRTLQELVTLQGEGSMFQDVQFSPSGDTLAAHNLRGVLHIWQAPSMDRIEQTASAGRP